MRKFGTLIMNDIRLLLRSKETFWLLIFMPLLLIFILGNGLSGMFAIEDQQIDPVKLGVVMLDEPPGGADQLLPAEQLAFLLTIRHYEDKDRMMDALKDGEIEYGLLVPERFTANAAEGREAVWELYPGQNHDRNLVAKSLLEGLLDRINFVQSAVIALGNPLAAEAAAASMEDTSAAERSYVNVMAPDMSGRDYSALQYYAAHMLVMFLLYAGMAAGLSIVEEKESRTMDRIYAAPVKPIQVLAGKIAGNGLFGLCQSLIIVVFTYAVYGLEWGSRSVHLLAACVFTVVASVSLAVIVAALAPNVRTMQTVFMTLTIAMTFLSGGFTPELGGFLEQLGEYTLSHWASQNFIHLMLDSADSVVHEHLTVLGAIAAGLFLISALLGRKAVSP